MTTDCITELRAHQCGCGGPCGQRTPRYITEAADLVEELTSLLTEARDRGLIYWEPNTDRGHDRKADMLARIEAAISKATA